MGLFDVFSKGGKYFGKAIEPKCEYCEHGKRASDGYKVLCTKKGMVDAGYHCPKFTYSPLKRIPVKQLERVGFLEGDYDEKEDKPIQKKTGQPAASAAQPAPANAASAAKPAPAPAPSARPAAETIEVPPAPVQPAVNSDLASLAAMAEAAGEYVPEHAAEEKPAENGDAAKLSDM